MDSILPERLLALVRPAFDLVLRRIRSLKRCVQACGCKIMTPRYAPQFGSRLHFKRCQALPKETPFPFFSGTPFFGTPCFLFFWFFLSPAKVGSLEMQPGAKLQAYLGVIILQPHACTQRFRLRILRRTRSNAGRTSARSLSGRIESIWETPSKERGKTPGKFCRKFLLVVLFVLLMVPTLAEIWPVRFTTTFNGVRVLEAFGGLRTLKMRVWNGMEFSKEIRYWRSAKTGRLFCRFPPRGWPKVH